MKNIQDTFLDKINIKTPAKNRESTKGECGDTKNKRNFCQKNRYRRNLLRPAFGMPGEGNVFTVVCLFTEGTPGHWSMFSGPWSFLRGYLAPGLWLQVLLEGTPSPVTGPVPDLAGGGGAPQPGQYRTVGPPGVRSRGKSWEEVFPNSVYGSLRYGVLT